MLLYHFSLATFKILSFSSLVFFVLNFILLGFHWDSWICKFRFYIKFEEFQPLFRQIFFYPIFSLFFWDCNYSRDRLCPQGMSSRLSSRYEILFSFCFFQSFFPSQFFRLDNFYWSILKFTDSFQYYLYYVKLSQWFFCKFYILYFFSSRTSCWFSLIVSISLPSFPIYFTYSFMTLSIILIAA